MVKVNKKTLMIELPAGSDQRMIEEIAALVNKKVGKYKLDDILTLIERHHRMGKRLPFKRDDIYRERACLR